MPAAVTSGIGLAVTPELWATEALLFLRENLLMARLVNRKYDDDFAQWGDQVHVRKHQQLTSQVWSPTSGQSHIEANWLSAAGNPQPISDIAQTNVEIAKTSTIAVTLDTLRYTQFLLEDFTKAVSIANIMQEYMEPAIHPISKDVDSDIITEFLAGSDVDGTSVANVASGGAAAGVDEDNIVDAKTLLDNQLCPQAGRVIVLGPNHENDLLKRALFHQADMSGSREVLVNANLGRKFGFDFFTSQNVPDDASDDHSLAFVRDVMTIASRRLPPPGPGAAGASVSLDALTMRVVQQYVTGLKGTVIGFDMLYGVQLLDANLGAEIQSN